MLNKSIAYVKQFNSNLWILSLGWFVGAMGFAISIPFIAIYFHSTLGLSLSQIGFFFGAMAVIRAIFQAVGGEISDRVERRKVLVYTQIIRSFAFLLMALAIYNNWGFWAIAGALFLNSVFGAMFHPAANAMVSDILPKHQRLDGYAITRAGGNLGWAVGPAMGGFMAIYSYGFLFVLSAIITFVSGLVFWIFLKAPKNPIVEERFKISDLTAIKDDPYLARHSMLIFILYLVVAQLIAPFSVYAVDIVKISEHQLGTLYTLNGLIVVFLQIPITKLLAKKKFTTQLALGAFIYAIGYSFVGFFPSYALFFMAMTIITTGEVFMSPPSLALTARLAPEKRMGRYMGIFGFFVALGWSFGPLFGGLILDHLGDQPILAWMAISSLAVIAGLGYMMFAKVLPDKLNYKE